MDKILFLSDFSKTAINIHEQMKTLFDATFLGFDLNKARAFIKEEKPVLAVAYVKDLPYESEHALHLLLGAEEIPFILIGSKDECHDFFNQGNIKKYIITPIAIKDILSQIESTVDIIECRLSKKEKERKEAEELAEMNMRKHILVVDDDIVTLRTVMNYLKDHYRVTVAKSGTAAISVLGKEIPDLILLDYEMPVCDGVQTLKLIRSEDKFKNIPVFFLTGVDDSEQVRTAVELMPEGYILKSTSQELILEKIKDFFDK